MSFTFQPPSSQQESISWVRLIRTPRIGPVGFFELLRRYGSASTAIEMLPQAMSHHNPLKIVSRAAAVREMEQLAKLGGRMVFWGNPDYPPLLQHIRDAPPVLSVVGNVNLVTRPMIAIVGARNASMNGLKIAGNIAKELSRYPSPDGAPYVILSGMARGIDSEAHKGGLFSSTVGVLAHGIDIEYPKSNRGLYAQMRCNGALVSESVLGESPTTSTFPRRNRIIAGCALATVVIDASLRSGSMITARLAANYGREVMAVPGTPTDARSSGCNKLIRDGAGLITNAEDIINLLQETPGLLRESARLSAIIAQQDAGATQQDLWHFDRSSHAADANNTESLDGAIYQRLLDLLSSVPCNVDDLVQELDLPAQVVLSHLVDMELQGRVEFVIGGQVVLLP